jgi:hypothetical protein
VSIFYCWYWLAELAFQRAIFRHAKHAYTLCRTGMQAFQRAIFTTDSYGVFQRAVFIKRHSHSESHFHTASFTFRSGFILESVQLTECIYYIKWNNLLAYNIMYGNPCLHLVGIFRFWSKKKQVLEVAMVKWRSTTKKIRIWNPKQLTMDLGGSFHGGMEHLVWVPIMLLEVTMVPVDVVAERSSL